MTPLAPRTTPPRRVPGYSGREVWLLLVPLVGCQAPLPAIFPPVSPALVWPVPPDIPRIRYVGQLRGPSSLGHRPQGWKALRAWLEGPPPVVDFSTPMAVAVAEQRLYVADPGAPGGPAVHVLDLSTRQSAHLRQAQGAALRRPLDVALGAGPAGAALAVADVERGGVFLFDLRGETLLPRERPAPLGAGRLRRPVSVSWCAGLEQWWVLDADAAPAAQAPGSPATSTAATAGEGSASGGPACLAFDRHGQLLRLVGGRGTAPGQFNYPAALCCTEWPAGGGPTAAGARIVVADSMNFRVQVLDPAGRPVLCFGQKGDAAGDFSLPRDVAVDSEGHLYVLDSQFENVQVFDEHGRLLMAFGEEGRGPGEFYLPSGITIDPQDRIWIADTYNRRVQVFQYLRESEQ